MYCIQMAQKTAAYSIMSKGEEKQFIKKSCRGWMAKAWAPSSTPSVEKNKQDIRYSQGHSGKIQFLGGCCESVFIMCRSAFAVHRTRLVTSRRRGGRGHLVPAQRVGTQKTVIEASSHRPNQWMTRPVSRVNISTGPCRLVIKKWQKCDTENYQYFGK